MTLLYLTADEVGIRSGGGIVTEQEVNALSTLASDTPAGCYQIWERQCLSAEIRISMLPAVDPWMWGEAASRLVDREQGNIKLVHVYSGTFTDTLNKLKEKGAKISYTAAAHSIAISRAEHDKFGLPYPQHLTDPEQWKRYLGGYLAADVVICPSTHSAGVMRGFGCKNIEVIPHGCHLPDKVTPVPKHFTVGALSSGLCAPDKGIIYLLQAWKMLNYKDATLIFGGKQSASSAFRKMIEDHGGGNIRLLGWVNDIRDFYDNISLLCQPSASEGFGLEVLESLAHGRQALCSEGTGAKDCVPNSWVFNSCDPKDLAGHIDAVRQNGYDWLVKNGERGRQIAADYTWEKIRARYVNVWKGLLK